MILQEENPIFLFKQNRINKSFSLRRETDTPQCFVLTTVRIITPFSGDSIPERASVFMKRALRVYGEPVSLPLRNGQV